MTKIAILNDIHGNITALNIVLNELAKNKPDYIFSPGDLIGIGPSSNEVVTRVKDLPNFYTVVGNHELYALRGYVNKSSSFEVEHHLWIKNNLTSEVKSYLLTLPYERYFIIENHKICLIHYGRYEQRFTPIYHNPTIDELDNLFKDIDAEIIIYGHEHPGLILKGKKTYINIGSLGCSNNNVGNTKYGILTINGENITINEYLIPYDITPELDKMDKYNMPDKENIKQWFYKK